MELTVSPVEMLVQEHQKVLVKLNALEEVFKHLDQRDLIRKELVDLTSFFKTRFWLHFDKEERALFPEFDGFMPRGVGPLAVMMDEHEVIRNTHEIMQEAIDRYLVGDDDLENKKIIIEKGSHFIEFLRDHITKENGLFPKIADMHLTAAQNIRITRMFKEIEPEN